MYLHLPFKCSKIGYLITLFHGSVPERQALRLHGLWVIGSLVVCLLRSLYSQVITHQFAMKDQHGHKHGGMQVKATGPQPYQQSQ